jgi:hypothetical protein
VRSAKSSEIAVYTVRIEREKLDQLRRIADAEHRTLVQKLRVMIEAEIAAHEAAQAAA